MTQNTGAIIREARLARGWTQRQLAEAAGLSVIAIKTLEGGKHTPSGDTLHKLAGALGIPVSTLLGEGDPYASPVPPVPTWRAAGVREDQIARAAAVWADLTRDQRRDISEHLQMSARSLATVDALIEQVQVRLDTLSHQAQEGHGAPPAGNAVSPEDALDIETDDEPTRQGHMLFSLG